MLLPGSLTPAADTELSQLLFEVGAWRISAFEEGEARLLFLHQVAVRVEHSTLRTLIAHLGETHVGQYGN